jgi:transposase
MRFAPVKSAEQQSVLSLHRFRELLIRQRTMLINAIRSLCGEFGLTVAQGAPNVRKLVEVIRDGEDPRLPDLGRTALQALSNHLDALTAQIDLVEGRIVIWHRSQAASRRLAAIQALGRLPLPRSSRRSAMRRRFDRGASSPPGSDWSRDSTRAAARNGSAASASGATVTSGGC